MKVFSAKTQVITAITDASRKVKILMNQIVDWSAGLVPRDENDPNIGISKTITARVPV